MAAACLNMAAASMAAAADFVMLGISPNMPTARISNRIL
jgi:hypothetical protein